VTLIPELLAAGPTWSIEFFPPRTEEAERQFRDTVAELAPLAPSFASVTYGALGSTKSRTRDIVIAMNASWRSPHAHLTCVDTHPESPSCSTLRRAGVLNILALGGDPPAEPPRGRRLPSRRSSWWRSSASTPPGRGGVAAHPSAPRSRDRFSDRRHLAANCASPTSRSPSSSSRSTTTAAHDELATSAATARSSPG